MGVCPGGAEGLASGPARAFRLTARKASQAQPAWSGSCWQFWGPADIAWHAAAASLGWPQAVRDGCVGLRARQGEVTVSAAGRRSGHGRASHGRAVWADTYLMPRFRVGRGGHGSLLQARIRE